MDFIFSKLYSGIKLTDNCFKRARNMEFYPQEAFFRKPLEEETSTNWEKVGVNMRKKIGRKHWMPLTAKQAQWLGLSHSRQRYTPYW